MTTFTLDTPIKIKKTHFKSPLEVVYYFSQLALKQNNKTIANDDPDRIVETPKNKKAYKQAMIDYEKGDVITIPTTIKTADEFISFLKQS